MRLSIPSIYLPSFLLFFLLPTPTSATKKSYVVYLGAHSHCPEQSPIDFNRVTETHYEFLASFLGSHALAKESILYSYARHINGFAATFDDEVAASIAKHPKVISVFLNKGRKLHTTRSWDFLGLEHDGVIASNSSWKKARYGEDTIIGNLDTGVWPESKSFSDEGMGPIPSKWKGICQNETDAGFHCNSLLCKNGTLDPRKVKGKILVCLRGQNARVDKGEQALLAGALGMVLANSEINGNEILADAHVLPASHINFTDGVAIFTYCNSTKSPKAYITRATTVLGTNPAPFMAAFSSKGPSTVVPEILKPDITAPGVSVLAAYTEAQGPTNQIFDERRVQFNSLSGTSMSCPHVSGIAGLLKTLHPTWSPAAIRSAIMTTAKTQDNRREPILNASYVKATPFSCGAGHVLPNSAMDPGLVYDLSINDYLNFICALGFNETQVSMFSDNPYKCSKLISLANLNYPSITIAKLSDSITVTRTLKNVGSPGTYRAHVQEPSGILVIVKPETLKFRKVDEEKSFNITLMVREAKASEDYVFGRLIWSDGKHSVKSPIVVKAV
ncbi:hypothetical protein I3842_03G273500 [Carya illinoinensis]|uniref:Subtilisin-like protease SBT5.3 n=1 Tax=Carya illinoinensis TaxID=32201 RepID=A0A922JYB3_CARIL|nr:hypothetical protein I3842_03G273500 [Carya illinoinensis]